jgi:hypothetical protein
VLVFDAMATATHPPTDGTVGKGSLALPAGRHWYRPGFGRRRARSRRRRGRLVGRRSIIAAVVVAGVVAGTAGALTWRDDRAPAAGEQPPGSDGRTGGTGAGAPTTATPPPVSSAGGPAASVAPVAAALVTSRAGYAEYRLSRPVAVVLFASGPCWLQIRQGGPAGQLLFQGDLLAGDSRGLTGATWVRLGNPGAVRITVNGTNIAPPTLVPGEPFNLQFD